MNSVEARRVMAVLDDTLDSLRCKASTCTDKTLMCVVLLLARAQSGVPRYRRGVDRGRTTVRHGWSGKTGNACWTEAHDAGLVEGESRAIPIAVHPTLLCTLQDIAQAMLRQMQHIQHAGGDPTAEELRFSTADLLQALKVLITIFLPGLFQPSRKHESLVVALLPLNLCLALL